MQMPWKNGQNTSVLYWKRGQRDTKNLRLFYNLVSKNL